MHCREHVGRRSHDIKNDVQTALHNQLEALTSLGELLGEEIGVSLRGPAMAVRSSYPSRVEDYDGGGCQ